MDREEHRAWLAQLAAEDRRRRALAEPEIARKEALLKQAQAKLAATHAAIADTRAALDQARREADDAGDAAPPQDPPEDER
jgi:hypothetical protein